MNRKEQNCFTENTGPMYMVLWKTYSIDRYLNKLCLFTVLNNIWILCFFVYYIKSNLYFMQHLLKLYFYTLKKKKSVSG